jgi:cytidylate kinase
MIIQIRGTSGSGKTTVMREVMKQFQWNPRIVKGRKKPLWYQAKQMDLAILGHYEESACGGCDTVGSARQVYELIQTLNMDVILCEGLLLSEDVKWARQMMDLRVIFLTTPLETCLERVAKRRETAGNDKPLNPANTTNRVATIERARVKLVELGVVCRRCTTEQASKLVLEWVRLHAHQGV